MVCVNPTTPFMRLQSFFNALRTLLKRVSTSDERGTDYELIFVCLHLQTNQRRDSKWHRLDDQCQFISLFYLLSSHPHRITANLISYAPIYMKLVADAYLI